ncbi:DUF6115 domain-containing protein [Senegalia massiliensis]|uniref:Uncharacterized protein n=1 Tax=Senegalia massiliensis TaxID=1720316 RepID=A0A845R2F8_9CLOT|nr:hypothetical protein [Senegalia massiliensis]NBI07886.1 hypothetical protein [Senegalia massiliensis]
MILSLLILGILLIIISILLLIKFKNEEDIKYNRINKIYNEINEYNDTLDDIILSLDFLINNNDIKSTSKEKESKQAVNLDNHKSSKVSTDTKRKIYSLYDKGNTIDEIAKLLNKGKREVEIILKLNNLNKF